MGDSFFELVSSFEGRLRETRRHASLRLSKNWVSLLGALKVSIIIIIY